MVVLRPALDRLLWSISGYQPRRPLVEEIIPRPVDQHEELVAKADQLNDVNPEPHHPRDKTARLHPKDIRDRRVAADRGERALIPIPERLERQPAQLALDVAGDRVPHLNRHRRDHRQRLAVLLAIRRIADDEDLRVSHHLQRWLDRDAALPARGEAECAVEGGGAHPSGPDDGLCGDDLAAVEANAVSIIVRYTRAEPHLDVLAPEGLARRFAQPLRH